MTFSKGILAALICVFMFGCATGSKVSEHFTTSKELSKKKLPKFDVPIVVNERVLAWVDYFQGTGKNHFARYLARSGRYLPLMQEHLKKYALPQDLVYIAMIESGFSHRAYSRAHAVGHWQFIRGTGRHYGLDIDSWIDERRDPDKATDAAARYLRDLYDEFGDWYLAMAAYNAGEGKIRKAIRRTGTRDFWEMIEKDRRFLRPETKDYVPKFIAAAIIAKSPERFGFGDVVYERPISVETSTVDSQTDVDVIAKCAGVSVDTVLDLNPELVRGITPPGAKNYKIYLPGGTAKIFREAYVKVPESERVFAIRYTVKRGDTIAKIARRHGVSARELMAANDIYKSSAVKKGVLLVIPTGGAEKAIARSIVASKEGRSRGKMAKYRVQKGETLGLIAQDLGVSVSDIKRWNRLKRNTIHQGQLLKIYGSDDGEVLVAGKGMKKGEKNLNYQIRRGDSWWKIAQKYGVSINDLKEWNPSFAGRDLVAGRRLKLFAEKPDVQPDIMASAKVELPNQSIQKPQKEEQMTPVQPAIVQPLIVEQQAIVKPQSLTHKVKDGDTLWDIAQKYGISVKDIKSWNNFSNASRLKPGDLVKLSED